jgi:hypothetical protein
MEYGRIFHDPATDFPVLLDTGTPFSALQVYVLLVRGGDVFVVPLNAYRDEGDD